jgi:hypothetical protein
MGQICNNYHKFYEIKANKTKEAGAHTVNKTYMEN